ncbi:MAG: apolipoprotein N-acyltransferase [Lentisphaerae bacterium]|nr:apolipoprotein N-acyltransferase [Lentisphaerota bacterium]MCP4100929.1 apolipoprotein N-acyltransferase [Lentisphaerota bacterium]
MSPENSKNNLMAIENEEDITSLKEIRPGNECRRVRWTWRILTLLCLFGSGALLSTAVPPLNWSVTAWFSLIPLYLIVSNQRWPMALLSGFVWGIGWAFPSFYWLYEINPVIPYLIAPVMACFYAPWVMLVPVLRRGIVYPNDVLRKGYQSVEKFTDFSPWRELVLAIVLSALWCVAEWVRSDMLPWNYLATTQWRNLPLVQMCSVTGTYGLSFVICLVNITFAMAIWNALHNYRSGSKFKRPIPFMFSLFLLMLLVVYGNSRIVKMNKARKSLISFNAGLVQGNISQRRNASNFEAQEALNIYLEQSYKLLKGTPHPDIIIWPETAVPYPYRAMGVVCEEYRYKLYKLSMAAKCPLLIGTIDFEDLPPGSKRYPGTLNSAFLFDAEGRFQTKYDKVHPVPFGEYVPFRKYLPQFIIKYIDMNRDLTAGTSFQPLPIHPGVLAGISICFEDVFPYISRREVLKGANMILVITNDAWYPKSSEPDQHLANSIFRAVETGVPMLRSGNNSASCLIQPSGYISDCLFTKKDPVTGKEVAAPEVRARKSGIIPVMVPANPELTFYTKHGDVFLLLCILISAGGLLQAAWSWRLRKTSMIKKFE